MIKTQQGKWAELHRVTAKQKIFPVLHKNYVDGNGAEAFVVVNP